MYNFTEVNRMAQTPKIQWLTDNKGRSLEKSPVQPLQQTYRMLPSEVLDTNEDYPSLITALHVDW